MTTETPGLSRPLALHAGNLEPSTTEMDLYTFFSEISLSVSSLRIIRDDATKHARYAYINFLSPEDAETALAQLNYKPFKGNEISLSRSIPASQRNPAANLYVSNLPENTSTEQLATAFGTFGTIISARISFTPTGTRHTYGYVQFESAEVANKAVEAIAAGPLTIGTTPTTIKAELFKPASERPRTLATNIFIRNFPVSQGKAGFEATMKKFGTVLSYCFQDSCQNLQKTGPSETGFGFADFSTHDEAQNAINEINKLTLDNFKLEAFPAKSKIERQREVSDKYRSFSTSRANVYVKHLPQQQSQEEIEQFFRSIGEVISLKLNVNEVGVRTGVGYIQYKTPEDANRAIQQACQRGWYAAIHQPKSQRQTQYRRSPYQQRQYHNRPMRRYDNMPYNIYPYHGPRHMYPRFRNPNGYNMRPYPPQQQHPSQQGGVPQQNGGRRHPQHMNRHGGRRMHHQGGHHNGHHQSSSQQNGNNTQRQLSPEEERQKLGEELYWKVQAIDDEQTPKITGMLLDMKPEEIRDILKDPELLRAKVEEAQEILKSPPTQ